MGFTKNESFYLVALGALALFIWVRDLNWITSAEDTLPILIALPVFLWLGAPWKKRERAHLIPPTAFIGPTVLFLFGILVNLTLLLSIAWTWLLWIGLSSRLDDSSLERAKKLLILPLMAFPWITLDASPLGWWFRLTGAMATGQLFSLVGASVERIGTVITINGLPINVEAACAGLNTLQSMFIAGSAVAYIILGESHRYWYGIIQLFVISWVANTLRILFMAIIGLSIGPEFAMGAFHTFGGWLVLTATFLLCWLVFTLEEEKQKSPL